MMTQLQRDAMTRAQAGDWSLADAMELTFPGHAEFDGMPLIGGYTSGGRLRHLIYADQATCTDCDGEGETECTECNGTGDVKCDECQGSGEVDGDAGVTKCKECNGEKVVDCEECAKGQCECELCSGSGQLDFDHAESVVVRDLNGRAVYRSDTDEDGNGWGDYYVNFDLSKARGILHRYHNPPKPKAEADGGAPTRHGTQSTIFAGGLAA